MKKINDGIKIKKSRRSENIIRKKDKKKKKDRRKEKEKINGFVI